MPADQPRGPNRGWKDQVPAPDKTRGKRPWQTGPVKPVGHKGPWSNKTKLGIATLALSALVGLIIGVALYFRPIKPACLVLVGCGYETNLLIPHNAYGMNGLNGLEALAPATGVIESWWPWAEAKTLRREPRSEFDPKRPWLPKTFPEPTMVAFLALHGAADQNGPYLLANDPSGQTLVYLEHVLDKLAELNGKKKLLILDATQVAANWPTGLLHNDFVRKLKEKLAPRIQQIPDLVVLCASDVDQRSWASEEWRQTIFAHFVIEGLKGAADKNGNGRITALELYQYARDNVQKWVKANRAADQTPILLGGETRADSIELVQVTEPYQAPDPAKAPGARFTVPQELEQAWGDCQNLRQGVPSPAVYTPHVWRRYQDTLLRYEQLLRAGDPTGKAEVLKSNLGSLKHQIEDARQPSVAPGTLAYALPLPAAFGLPAPALDNDSANSPWRAEPDKLEKALDDQQLAWAKGKSDGRATPLAGPLFRVAVARSVLERLTTEPGLSHQELERARQIVQARGFAKPRPAEAHFLVMLLRDIDRRDGDTKRDAAEPKISAAELMNALRIRMRAEEAALAAARDSPGHPYSEVILPWVQQTVRSADALRRVGEDWLFGPDEQAWKKGHALLEEAAQKYEAAGKIIRTLQEALATRDRVLAALPYYAEWLARQPAPAPALLQKAKALGEGVDKLSDLLARKALDDVPGLTKQVLDDFGEIKSTFDGACLKLSNETAVQQHFWHEVEALLAVPLVDHSKVRMGLLSANRARSSQLNRGDTAGDKAPELNPLERGKQQGEMAALVASLSERDLKVQAGGKLEPLVSALDPAGWQDRLTQAGELLRTRWERMRDVIEKGRRESITKTDLADAAAALVVPESLCRLVPGAYVAPPDTPVKPFDAVEASRRLRLHDLLLWQAERTLADHWFDDSTSRTDTYYFPVARAYAKEALTLAQAGTDPVVDKDRVAKAQAMTKRIEFVNLGQPDPGRQDVTSEAFEVAFNFSVPKDMPPGVPWFWLELPEKAPVKAKNAGAGRRQTLEEPLPGNAKLEFPMRFPLEKAKRATEAETTLSPRPPAVQSTKATLRGVFRGQQLDPAVDLTLYEAPMTVVHVLPPPQVAGLAVRMDKDFSYGAVCIVLDCSNSMNYGFPVRGPGKNNVKGSRRFDYALEALKAVLKNLPKDTYLSVCAFGHANARRRIEWIRTPQRWGEGQFRDLEDRVDRLRPAGRSPIAQALMQGGAEGFPANYTGPKVLLALTDGDDNETFGGDPKQISRELDKALNDGQTDVNVVCFNNGKERGDKEMIEEAENAELQFGGVKKFTLPGSFAVAPNADALASRIEQALRPTVRMKAPGFPKEGLFVNRPKENLKPEPLKPGVYSAAIQKIYLQDIRFDPGEIVSLTLMQKGTKLVLVRNLFALQVAKLEQTQKKDDWLVAVLQNRLWRGEGVLQQKVSVEQAGQVTVGDNSGPFQTSKPGFVWMEVKPKGDKKARPTVWYNQFGYPAPTFSLKVRDWPDQGDTSPDAQVWWARAPAEDYCKIIEHPAEAPLRGTLYPKTFPLAGGTVRIESIELEDQLPVVVSSDPAVKPQAKRCLVLRLSHPPGQPVWVQALGLSRGGEQHKFYPEAGKYTAIFWGVSAPEQETFNLNVVSLQAFKDHRETKHVRLDNLPRPREDDNFLQPYRMERTWQE